MTGKGMGDFVAIELGCFGCCLALVGVVLGAAGAALFLWLLGD